MGNIREPFLPETVYHIYNHANGNDQIFVNSGNYPYFLKKYAEHLTSVFNTYAYCLMPNHFHFMVRVKSRDELIQLFKEEKNLSNKISQRLGNFLNAYSKAFNLQQKRKGGLFYPSTKRKSVKDENYFTDLILYIHTNPVLHGFTKNLWDWKQSSYHSLISKKPTLLNRKEVLNWFGGREKFINFHQENNS